MPQVNSLLIGPANTVVQTTSYALPARAVRVLALAAIDISVDGNTWNALTNANTIGADCAGGFVRCTVSTTGTSIICKAY